MQFGTRGHVRNQGLKKAIARLSNNQKEVVMTYVVYKMMWEESERGWGTRPDGYSLHLSPLHAELFIREYWDTMPDEIPDEYSRPGCEPFPVEVDEETFDRVKNSKYGIRRF